MAGQLPLNVSSQGVEGDVHPGIPPHVQYTSPLHGPIPVEVEEAEVQ